MRGDAVTPGMGMPLGRDPSGLTFLRCPLIGHTHNVGGDSLVSVLLEKPIRFRNSELLRGKLL
eukprot:COSAG05_NODE_309_length_11646_cov_7.176929_1_plen_62_part_10